VRELNEMLKSVGQEMDLAELQEIIAEYDEDQSGEIDFDEFIQIFVKILGANDPDDSDYDDEGESGQDSADALAAERKRSQMAGSGGPENGAEGPIVMSEAQISGKASKPKQKPKMLKILAKEFRFEPGIDMQRLKAHLDDTHPRELTEADSEEDEAEDDEDKEEDQTVLTESPAQRPKVKRKFGCCSA